MCTVLLVIKLTKLRAQLLATLASALLITLIADPGALTDVGLQLSYAATAGLILCARPLSELICAGRKEKIIRWFAETVAVVFASQLAVLPIQLVYFWQLGLMFLPANLVITPILAPLTILGFVSSVLALFFPLHGFVESTFSLLVWMVDMLALLPLELMLRWVDFLDSFDGAIFRRGTASTRGCSALCSELVVCSGGIAHKAIPQSSSARLCYCFDLFILASCICTP